MPTIKPCIAEPPFPSLSPSHTHLPIAHSISFPLFLIGKVFGGVGEVAVGGGQGGMIVLGGFTED